MKNNYSNLPTTVPSLLPDGNLLKNCIAEYNQKLVDTGIRKSRKQIKNQDFIDARPLLFQKRPQNTIDIPSIAQTPERSDYIRHNYWYCTIPCFETGTIQINDDRYIYYQLKNIDTLKNTYSVYLEDYKYTGVGWEGGVSGTVQYDFPMTKNSDGIIDGHIITKSMNDILDYPELYRIFNAKDMHWTNLQYDIWVNTIIDNAVKTEQNFAKNGTNAILELSKAFIHVIMIVNHTLSLHKPKIKSNAVKSKISKKKIYDTESAQPKRRTRIIGMIQIKSEKPPKQPTKETVTKYKIASWKTRGHIRTYKSGKQIWIKESVHHRKCLQSIETPKTTIKFKNNTKGGIQI